MAKKSIEEIARDILNGLYGNRQQCGTEWQKYTYAIMQARAIHAGDIEVDPQWLINKTYSK